MLHFLQRETYSLKVWKTCSAEECGPAGLKPGLFTQCKQEASYGCNKENWDSRQWTAGRRHLKHPRSPVTQLVNNCYRVKKNVPGSHHPLSPQPPTHPPTHTHCYTLPQAALSSYVIWVVKTWPSVFKTGIKEGAKGGCIKAFREKNVAGGIHIRWHGVPVTQIEFRCLRCSKASLQTWPFVCLSFNVLLVTLSSWSLLLLEGSPKWLEMKCIWH